MVTNKKINLLLLLLFVCMITACSNTEPEKTRTEIYGYEASDETDYILENEKLEFHLDTETTQFTVTDKDTGYTWYSNPQDADGDVLADNSSKKALYSTLSMAYTTTAGVETTYNNFAYSIENGLYEVEQLENAIKVNYSIGNVERSYLMPTAVPESRMQVFLDQMDSKGQKQIKEYYRKFDITNLRATDDKSELVGLYPDLETECVYVLREGMQEYLKVKLEGILEAAGYTYEDYELDLARYSNTATTSKPVFNVSMVYTLEGGDLVVTVPMEDIQYDPAAPITKIKILPFFGAGGLEDQGYLFVPEGPGALIEFNNGKTAQSSYYSQVYGWDYGTYRSAVVDEVQADFPVFGISNGNASFVTILEEGSAYAYIEADISGRFNSYNYAYASYDLIHGENMDVSAKSDKTVRVFEESLPEEEIVQRYRFLDTTDYTSMATNYREYLMERYDTLAKMTNDSVPITFEVIGAIDRVRHIFGVPVAKPVELTTYKEALTMLEELHLSGYQNMNMKYVGWFNNGVIHGVSSDIDLIGALGTKKDFKTLLSKAEDLGVPMYLESFVEYVFRNTLWDGFVTNRDSAKYVSRELAEIYDYSTVWYGEEDWNDFHYLVRPSYTMKLIDELVKSAKEYGSDHVSFADLGRYLSADYNPKKKVSREANLTMQQEKLKELSEQDTNVMLYRGNAYAAPFATFITDIKLEGKQYNIIDQEIPFYEIALHGLVPYAGTAMNLSKDYETNVLKSIEYGAGLYYVFMDEPTSTLQDTDHTKYFGSDYSLWKDRAKQLYEELNKELGHTYNQFITKHEQIAEGVRVTTYEDGTKVYVNYNFSEVTVGKLTINERGYLVEKGGANSE